MFIIYQRMMDLNYLFLLWLIFIIQEVDIAPCGSSMSHSKYQRVDLSVPWLIQPLRIVVPWPKEENQQLIAVTRPFQLEVS